MQFVNPDLHYLLNISIHCEMGGKSSKMGHVMGKLSDFLHVDCRFPISGERESRILMLGLDAAGKAKPIYCSCVIELFESTTFCCCLQKAEV